MQQRITLTTEALDALREHRVYPDTDWSQDTWKNPDGTWDILVNDEVIEGLHSVRFPGESYSDIILRAAALYRKKPQ